MRGLCWKRVSFALDLDSSTMNPGIMRALRLARGYKQAKKRTDRPDGSHQITRGKPRSVNHPIPVRLFGPGLPDQYLSFLRVNSAGLLVAANVQVDDRCHSTSWIRVGLLLALLVEDRSVIELHHDAIVTKLVLEPAGECMYTKIAKETGS